MQEPYLKNQRKNMDIKYEVILTEKAKIELDSIYQYIAKSFMAKETAKRFIDKVKKSILRLEDMPELCSIIEEYNFREEYRKLVINNYVAIYRIDREHKKVYITRIIYGGRNYLNDIW